MTVGKSLYIAAAASKCVTEICYDLDIASAAGRWSGLRLRGGG